MQIVIEMNEKAYKEILEDIDKFKRKGMVVPYLYEVIESGTPLPKEHGDLIDRGELKTHFIGTEQGTDLEVYLEPTVVGAQIIIKADKSESEEYV